MQARYRFLGINISVSRVTRVLHTGNIRIQGFNVFSNAEIFKEAAKILSSRAIFRISISKRYIIGKNASMRAKIFSIRGDELVVEFHLK